MTVLSRLCENMVTAGLNSAAEHRYTENLQILQQMITLIALLKFSEFYADAVLSVDDKKTGGKSARTLRIPQIVLINSSVRVIAQPEYELLQLPHVW